MARKLDVYIDRQLAGNLLQDDGGQMSFSYCDAWLDDPFGYGLSQSLPLRRETYMSRECKPFFGGLLPEETARDTIAQILSISRHNDFAMLERIGGDCAGAVSFIVSGQKLPATCHSYHDITEEKLAKILRELPVRPLMVGEAGTRLSLAGAQYKTAIHVHEDRVSLPDGGAPSTHIVKPGITKYEGVVQNELLCMNLAKAIGLPVATVSANTAEGIEYLLVERYDRLKDVTNGSYSRMHQEDFCQARFGDN